MLIECTSCQKKLNISEDKIPFGRPFSFTCPNCKVKNTMTLPERRVTEISLEGDDPPQPAAPRMPYSPQSRAATQSQSASPPISTSLAPPEFQPPDYDDAPEGLKLAMLAFDSEEVMEKLEERLTSMGYKVLCAVNVRDAVKQLKFGRFQLILIQEDYYGATLMTNQVIRAVNSLELSVRHDMFVALIGSSFTSLDDLTAFSLSLDTVINANDLDDIERLLISAIGHLKKFMAPFREQLSVRGII
ncbi:MAG: zinc-ribbon domain-containing protein [Deltaproteobacteria bacterium]|jgi:hypothetical protein|nr:zinc-ribbon domain-containing protein [Deltaproteobacteria bacterium]